MEGAIMFDKQIHRDDFRLRILVTNKCNKSCYHCLNDFQVKGDEFLGLGKSYTIINSYCSFMKRKGLEPRVEFSGGEPGLHPELYLMLRYAKTHNAFIKVNTNGLALKKEHLPFVDCWHVGVTDCDRRLLHDMISIGAQAQYVVTYDKLIMGLPLIAHFYRSVPLKLFMDFYEDGDDLEMIEGYIDNYASMYPNIKTRYTGVQENRGIFCKGCNRKCITLKAIWLFPDGSLSLCPQRQRKIHSPYSVPSMEMLYQQHKKE